MTSPIGFFDSGVGGTSIWQEVVALLPNENTVYLADSKHAPYGEKSKEVIQQLCVKNTELLLSKGCKIIIVACNTATTNAIDFLRATYDVPIIGIEPAIKPASIETKTNIIGILATKGTLNSDLFEATSKSIRASVRIVEQIGEGLVALVENGQLQTKTTSNLLKRYLEPMLQQNIDCLVLGCTHYPYLIPQIRELIGNDITIIDSGAAVAKQTHAVLAQYDLDCKEIQGQISHQFFTNTSTKTLEFLLESHLKHSTITTLDF